VELKQATIRKPR